MSKLILLDHHVTVIKTKLSMLLIEEVVFQYSRLENEARVRAVRTQPVVPASLHSNQISNRKWVTLLKVARDLMIQKY